MSSKTVWRSNSIKGEGDEGLLVRTEKGGGKGDHPVVARKRREFRRTPRWYLWLAGGIAAKRKKNVRGYDNATRRLGQGFWKRLETLIGWRKKKKRGS